MKYGTNTQKKQTKRKTLIQKLQHNENDYDYTYTLVSSLLLTAFFSPFICNPDGKPFISTFHCDLSSNNKVLSGLSSTGILSKNPGKQL